MARLAAAGAAAIRVAGGRRPSRRIASLARLERQARLVLARPATARWLPGRQHPQPLRRDPPDGTWSALALHAGMGRRGCRRHMSVRGAPPGGYLDARLSAGAAPAARHRAP